MPEFTVNSVWGSKPVDQTEEVTVPSGQTCRVRRIGMEGLMEAGILGDADTLTGIVDQKHVRRVRGANGIADHDDVDPASIMRDPNALKAILRLADKAMPHVVVEPVVLLHFNPETDEPIPAESREDGAVYTDMIGFEDKMYLLDYAVGGTRDVATFRQGSETAVAGVADGEGVPVSPKRAGGSRKRKKR